MAADVDGVLLAGGCSCRAGVFKLEAEVGGKPLLRWGLEAMASVCGRVFVVAGHDAERIAALAAGSARVEVVINERYAEGMLSSVQAGAACVRAPRFFVLPGDMPLVRPAVFRQLLEREADVVVPACNGRRGHPVLLDRSLVPAILAEPPGSSLGRLLRRRQGLVVETGDPGVLADLDLGEDFEEIGARLRREGRS